MHVSSKQLRLHRTTEGLSLFIGAPLMLWIAMQGGKLTPIQRVLLASLGIGAIIVDGHLWTRFHRASRRRHSPRWRDRLPGGLADEHAPEDFDPDELARGVQVELEHTDDPELAKEIAMDHLVEDPAYYQKLALIDPH